MILYHLNKRKYRKIWPPEGSLHAEGRWNKPGQWVIYTSPTVSLAKLEILANVNNMPLKYVCMTIEVEDRNDIFEVKTSDLPDDWMQKPHPAILSISTNHFISSKSLLMKVPSAQSYREYNYLINVRHKDFNNNVRLVDIEDEHFDKRLTR